MIFSTGIRTTMRRAALAPSAGRSASSAGSGALASGPAAVVALVVAVSLVAASSPALAQADAGFKRYEWCDATEADRRRAGFLFYCDEPPDPPPDEAKEMEPEEPVAKLPPPAPAPEPERTEPTAVERLAAITAAVEEARAEAILNPDDREKVAAYMRLQAEVVEQASTFSDTWRRVVWGDPDLDYTRRRPTNTVAGSVFHEARTAAERRTIKEITKTHGLFFIFEGAETCLTCAAQAAVLENMARYHEVPVLGVSRDGSALPQFPNPLHDPERLEELGLSETPVPALVLVEPVSGAVQPIAFAAIAEDQILQRIFVITQSEPGDLY